MTDSSSEKPLRLKSVWQAVAKKFQNVSQLDSRMVTILYFMSLDRAPLFEPSRLGRRSHGVTSPRISVRLWRVAITTCAGFVRFCDKELNNKCDQVHRNDRTKRKTQEEAVFLVPVWTFKWNSLEFNKMKGKQIIHLSFKCTVSTYMGHTFG